LFQRLMFAHRQQVLHCRSRTTERHERRHTYRYNIAGCTEYRAHCRSRPRSVVDRDRFPIRFLTAPVATLYGRHYSCKLYSQTSTVFMTRTAAQWHGVAYHLITVTTSVTNHHLSLPLPFTPDLKLISFTNPFLHSHSDVFRTAFTDLEPVLN